MRMSNPYIISYMDGFGRKLLDYPNVRIGLFMQNSVCFLAIFIFCTHQIQTRRQVLE